MRLDSVLIACLLSFTFACQSGDDGKSDSGVTETGDPSTNSDDVDTNTNTDTDTDTDTNTDTDTDTDTDADTSGDGVTIGDLDFGSGGDSSGVTTYAVTVTNDIIAYPFTVIQGAYYGGVSIGPTSSPFPNDGTGIRMWWSETAGGQPLAGDQEIFPCSANLEREGTRYWDQSGTKGYGCTIDNVASMLYLNFQACISTPDDTTCGAVDVQAGSAAPIYIKGQFSEVQ